nr:hypothetical protein [Rickettsia endosymbiont of Ceutorhynchus assimilis]
MPPRNDDSGSHATTPLKAESRKILLSHAEFISASLVKDPETSSG